MDKPGRRMHRPAEIMYRIFENKHKPARKMDKPACKMDKPVCKIDKPACKMDKPVRKIDKPARKMDKPARVLAILLNKEHLIIHVLACIHRGLKRFQASSSGFQRIFRRLQPSIPRLAAHSSHVVHGVVRFAIRFSSPFQRAYSGLGLSQCQNRER